MTLWVERAQILSTSDTYSNFGYMSRYAYNPYMDRVGRDQWDAFSDRGPEGMTKTAATAVEELGLMLRKQNVSLKRRGGDGQ